jgi:hypothetical protein
MKLAYRRQLSISQQLEGIKATKGGYGFQPAIQPRPDLGALRANVAP